MEKFNVSHIAVIEFYNAIELLSTNILLLERP